MPPSPPSWPISMRAGARARRRCRTSCGGMGPSTWTALGGICGPAIADLCACRTEALRGQLWPCEHGGQEHYVYHSSRHPSCPKCHRLDTEAWLEERRHELLPVPYFHVVFTVPHEW